MASRILRPAWTACILALALGTRSSGAQTSTPPAPTGASTAQATEPTGNSEISLRAMCRMADVIFSGQVLAIDRHEAPNGATGVVEIVFSVGDAIRGVGAGTYTVREWGGLWAAGYEPFHVGERYLMLLHAPGAAGLSSPVGGSDGAIPIRGDGGLRVAGVPALAGRAVVDLRWVATRAVHALSYGAETAERPTSLQFALRANAVDAGAGQLDRAGPTQGEASAADGAAYTTLLGKLRTWESRDHAAR